MIEIGEMIAGIGALLLPYIYPTHTNPLSPFSFLLSSFRYCPLSLSSGPVLSPCPLSLSFLPVLSPCPLSLSSLPVLSPCPLSLSSLPVLSPCPLSLSFLPVFPE